MSQVSKFTFLSPDSSLKSRLDVVQIYFDTTTYDEIQRDVKVKFGIRQLCQINTYMRFVKNISRSDFQPEILHTESAQIETT